MGHQGLSLRTALVVLLLAGLLACVPRPAPRAEPATGAVPPPAPREFRAAWIATVANIDWPRSRTSSPEVQRSEARALIARARDLGLNALILQVRPAADAIYPSDLEPWTEYLTGRQGQPPVPTWDPLAFWIQEAHAAGLELHAWFNPYRVRHSTGRSAPAPGHLSATRPGLVRTYGDQLWMDPAEPAAMDHSLAVVLEVVRRYAVDGVHFDDYFYPYPVKDAAGQKVDFPDDGPWQAYRAGGGPLERPAWRRRQVDRFIQRVYEEVHRLKPGIKVGISPFGLGRPALMPAGLAGFSQYDDLYADVEGWLDQGWLDYLVPQLYWKRDSPQPFRPLLDYWRSRNALGRHLWPGLFTSQVGAPAAWAAQEITAQIAEARSGNGSLGHAHFSLSGLVRNADGVADRVAEAYGGPALVPATPWLAGPPPPAPAPRLVPQGAALRLAPGPGPAPWLAAVWARYGGSWHFSVAPGGEALLPERREGRPLDLVVVSAVDRQGQESPRVTLLDRR